MQYAHSCYSIEKRESFAQKYKEKHSDANYCLPLSLSKLKNKRSAYNKDSDSFETC